MRSSDRPLLLLIVAAIVALGLWGKDQWGPKGSGPIAEALSDGLVTAQADPHQLSAAPKTYWGTYKATAFVLYRSNGPQREFIVKFDLPDIPNREGWR